MSGLRNVKTRTRFGGLRAFVCMADLLFALSAGIFFLNSRESEGLNPRDDNEEEFVNARSMVVEAENIIRETNRDLKRLNQLMEQVKQYKK